MTKMLFIISVIWGATGGLFCILSFIEYDKIIKAIHEKKFIFMEQVRRTYRLFLDASCHDAKLRQWFIFEKQLVRELGRTKKF